MDAYEKALHTICDFAADLTYQKISEKDKLSLKVHFKDFFSAALAGYRINRTFNEAVEKTLFSQGGSEESTALFSNKKIPSCNAALLSGMYVSGGEMDDGHRRANAHPQTAVTGAILALAENHDVTEQDVLTAIAVGYELMIRLSAAVQPGQGDRGFHPSGMTGTIASAAACAKLLGFNEKEFMSAISAAVLQCNGILTSENFKPLSPGRAAYNGVFSSKLVEAGALAEGDPFKKCTRWFRAVSGTFDETEFDKINTGSLAVSECYLKLYPACRHLHGVIDAALEIREKIDVSKIEHIDVYLYKSAYGKATDIIHPQTVGEAKFSTAYVASYALTKGHLGIDDLDPANATEEIKELSDKFSFILDEKLEDRKKGIRGVKMTVRSANNEETYAADLPKGEPERPATEKDLHDKFVMCSKGLLKDEDAEKLYRWADEFGEDKDRKFSTI